MTIIDISDTSHLVNMEKYSRIAKKRYRHYIMQQKKESLTRQLVVLVLRLLEALTRMLAYLRITKRRQVQKVNVE